MTAAVSLSVGGLLITPPCPWLPPGTGAETARVVHEAHASLGITERPLGSNRGPQIDQWLRDARVPESVILSGKGYWCAAWAGAMRRKAGLEMPAGYADCDVILRWGMRTGRWSAHVPSLGALVLYGKKGADGAPTDATHVGVVIQLEPLMTAEGNTTVEGPRFERNGTAVALKLVDSHDPVLGYVHIWPFQ